MKAKNNKKKKNKNINNVNQTKEKEVIKEETIKENIHIDWDLWDKVIKQIPSTTTRQILKDHMTIDKVTDSEVVLIHDNSMIAKTMFDKEHKWIEDVLEKELWKRGTLSVEWMSKEEYFKKLMNK